MGAVPVIVMKFGGTSVATPEGRSAIASRVSAARAQGLAPVVVVSAMGRKGAPYATDTLLGLLDGLPADARERDLLASTGELISAVVVAHELRATGVPALALSGVEAGICTDGVFESAGITHIYPQRVFDACRRGEVPVVAGFQGVAADGSLTTLGRGGSDTSACALGVALGAESVEIYTDVDGIMTADPRACADAAVLQTITADELFQMARSGSRVVHTPAAELALNSGIAVRVRNTYTDHPGTLVADIAGYRTSSAVATAVSHTTGVVRIRVELPAAEGTDEHMQAQALIYRAMADAGVSLDMFTPGGQTLQFTVGSQDLDRAREVLRNLGLTCAVRDGLAKVTLVGAGMHGVPGVMARVAEALAGVRAHVLQTADSHTTISVLVPAEEHQMVVQALHRAFGLGV